MIYYQRHPSDYQRDTGHLSLMEHGVYTVMLDAYYVRTQPLPKNRDVLCRLIRAFTPEERAAVDSVLREFWTEEDGGYVNARAQKEIEKAIRQVEKNRRIAAAREAKRAKHEDGTTRGTSGTTDRATDGGTKKAVSQKRE